MDAVYAVWLGIIQGITEFLPISSSGHLVLMPLFTGEDDQGVAFDLAVHIGTLLAVVLYFRKDVVGLVACIPRGGGMRFIGERTEESSRIFLFLVVSTVLTGLVGMPLLLSALNLESIGLFATFAIGFFLIFTGVLQKYAKGGRGVKEIKEKLAEYDITLR